ncbi:HEAT repeat domain-containing protein [Neobacillus kokaensis]|uniref:HEAT repeat domain-containing protein n=1 Tax=Neobacillus kokaensis TaxID=2759023 RepID=A0ABQ3N1S3_9BACI|nr:hypothetical protein [Neobacillus kokaensis]GHH98056.1 hypothetical protein AM1BK_15990 [Neobacillus kokaensis]
MIEISLAALFIVFIALLFLLVSIFFYLFVKKYFNNQTRMEIFQLKEDYQLDMFHYLQTGNGEWLNSSLNQEQLIALMELLTEYSNVLDGPVVEDRIREFADKYLTSFIKKELKKGRWSLRMNALYAIEGLYMKQLIPSVHALYKKRRTTIAEKSQIVKLLARFHDPQVPQYLKDIHEDLSNFSLLSIVSNLEEKTLDELIENFNELSKKLQYVVIDTIGKKQLTHHHMLLHRLLSEDDEELRIRSLKAYANSGLPIDTNLLAAFFESDNWQVRMMAAKVTGVERIERFKLQLIYLLSDREYIVRSEAAKSILRFRDGEGILTMVVDQTKDLFAKDMAIEWLEKERNNHSY